MPDDGMLVNDELTDEAEMKKEKSSQSTLTEEEKFFLISGMMRLSDQQWEELRKKYSAKEIQQILINIGKEAVEGTILEDEEE